MKKDFSQSFEKAKSHYLLIVRHKDRFFLIRSTNSYEKGWFSILHLEIEPDADELLAIVKFLETKDFSVTATRELNRTKSLGYSFVDDTPGSISEHIGLLIDVDVHDNLPQSKPEDEEEYLFVPLEEYIENYHNPDSPYKSEVLTLSLAKLAAEK